MHITFSTKTTTLYVYLLKKFKCIYSTLNSSLIVSSFNFVSFLWQFNYTITYGEHFEAGQPSSAPPLLHFPFLQLQPRLLQQSVKQVSKMSKASFDFFNSN